MVLVVGLIALAIVLAVALAVTAHWLHQARAELAVKNVRPYINDVNSMTNEVRRLTAQLRN